MISILIAPMETRITQDAYFQELMLNNKNILAFKPIINDKNELLFKVYYPEDHYYITFLNTMFHDDNIHVFTLSFELIEGWIDTYENDDKTYNSYVKDAFNAISSNLALQLESYGYHSFVYGSQRWKEHHPLFIFPNTIYIAVLNPFPNNISNSSSELQERLNSLTNQLSSDLHDIKLTFTLSSHIGFENRISEILFDNFKKSLLSKEKKVHYEYGNLPWSYYKNSMIESVFFHHFDIYPTGLFRQTVLKYSEISYSSNSNNMFNSDHLPMFAYQTFRNFLFNWIALEGIGKVNF